MTIDWVEEFARRLDRAYRYLGSVQLFPSYVVARLEVGENEVVIRRDVPDGTHSLLEVAAEAISDAMSTATRWECLEPGGQNSTGSVETSRHGAPVASGGKP